MARSNPKQGGEHNHYNDAGFRRGWATDKRLSETKVLAELRAMGEHVVAAAKEALKSGVDDVVEDAKSRCPVKTGRLRDSIKAISNKDGSVYIISADASVYSPKSESGRFYYGAIVEFSPKINKPFLYPALDAHRQEIYDKVEAAISKAVRST